MPALDNPKWERVVQLVARGESQTEAYFRVYKSNNRETAKTQASVTLSNPIVRDRLNELIAQFAKRYEITTDKIQRELVRVAFSNLTDYVRIEEDGNARVDLTDLDRTKGAAVSEVTATKRVTRRGDEREEVNETKIKIASPAEKIRALELLGKQLGMFKQKTELSTAPGAPLQVVYDYKNLTDEQLLALEAIAIAAAAPAIEGEESNRAGVDSLSSATDSALKKGWPT